MGLRLRPLESSFYDLFAESASHLVKGAGLLAQMLDQGSDKASIAEQMREAEHQADETTHRIVKQVNSTFITPFDREDIYMMSGALDDIVDLIDDAARAIIIFDVQEITDYARDFASVIERMADELKEIVSTLQRPKNVTQRLVEIHRLENEGDDIYHAAIAELFHDPPDALTVLKWKEVYEKLEAAVDRCENVANIIESVIIKHT